MKRTPCLSSSQNNVVTFLFSVFFAVSEFFAEYGWYILLAAIVLVYLQNRFGSKINKWQQKRSNESGLAHYGEKIDLHLKLQVSISQNSS